MFDIGFSELVVIFIIALFVFGPQKLPQIARFIAKAINKLKYETDNVKKVIEKEVMEDNLVKTNKDHNPDFNVYERLNKGKNVKKESNRKKKKREQKKKKLKVDNTSKTTTNKSGKKLNRKEIKE
ncbi:MAG: Sec-independent protein translocase protein TatB [bacterium]|nr:Sec-independent protein translocase protein TatB [bacterium]